MDLGLLLQLLCPRTWQLPLVGTKWLLRPFENLKQATYFTLVGNPTL